MEELSDDMEHLNTAQESKTLLTLPPELRIRCYATLFSCPYPIEVSVNKQGVLGLKSTINHIPNPVPFLQTCRQVHDEASVFFYSTNIFEFHGSDQDNLARLQMSMAHRMCMRSLQMRCNTATKINLSLIGQTFPALQDLHVLMRGSGPGLLLATVEMSDSILNSSDLRPWPQLSVVAEICQDETKHKEHEDSLYLDGWPNLNGYEHPDNLGKQFCETLKTYRQTLQLGLHIRQHSQRPCRMGSEMPEHLRTITLQGVALEEHLRAISSHECAFGDCGFRKVRSELVSENSQDTSAHEYRKHTYVWQKRGELLDASAIRGKDMMDNAAVMHQWVPRLSADFLEALMKDNGKKSDEPRQDTNEPSENTLSKQNGIA